LNTRAKSAVTPGSYAGHSHSFSGSWCWGAEVDQKPPRKLDRLFVVVVVVVVCDIDGAKLLKGTRELVVLLLLS